MDPWFSRPGCGWGIVLVIPTALRVIDGADAETQERLFPLARYLNDLYAFYMRRGKTRPDLRKVYAGTWKGCDVCGDELRQCECFIWRPRV